MPEELGLRLREPFGGRCSGAPQLTKETGLTALFRATVGLRWLNRDVALLLAALLLALPTAASAIASASEQKLIEQLIHDVAEMRDIVFIRNGSEYDSKEAAAHLREKYLYFRKDIETADDFIRLCATRSELSHRAYRVRDGHGVEQESAVFLLAHLARLRAAAATAPAHP
jgi:hypothetical protein